MNEGLEMKGLGLSLMKEGCSYSDRLNSHVQLSSIH
jgi:hypothetical protein